MSRPIPGQGITGGEVLIGEITDAVPADVKAEAEKLRDAIAAGTYHPFTGPINKQDGSAWLAEGADCAGWRPPGHELLCRGHQRRYSAVSGTTASFRPVRTFRAGLFFCCMALP